MSIAAPPHHYATYLTALMAYRMKISVVPIPPTGRKCPEIAWKQYQERRAGVSEIIHWFVRSQDGIAFITGMVSGGLECLDFDTHAIYHQWSERMYEQGYKWLHQQLTQGYLEATPNGIHLLYRCPTCIEGNQKLASSASGKSLIETRGEGGLVVVAPSCGKVHPTEKPYVLQQGSIATIPTITSIDRQTLFTVARTFHVEVNPPVVLSRHAPSPRRQDTSRRPGDIYNEQVSWHEILEPHGWKFIKYVGEEGRWQRPDKSGREGSATTNHNGHDLLYVFSSSTYPFESDRGYTKFTVYAILNHKGNFSDAAKALAEQGYTDKH